MRNVVAVLLLSTALATSAAAQTIAVDTVLGIHLGQAIDAQMQPCADDAYLMTRGPAPCWRRDPAGGRVAALPEALLRDIDAPISIRRLREVNRAIVEIEAEIRPEYVAKILAHLSRVHGKPAEVESYDRASRVTGRSRHRAHTWKSGGATMFLVELAGNDMGQLRAVLDSWAAKAK